VSEWLPYERGRVVRDTRDDHAKLRQAWRVIAARRVQGLPVVNLTGLERSFDAGGADSSVLDDELAPALLGERLRALALEHLGGDDTEDDVFLANRATAGLVAAMQVVVPAGGVVVGVSAGYSHPAVVRSVRLAGGRFVDTVGAGEFAAALGSAPGVDAVVVTRLAVTYEALPEDELAHVVAAAQARDLPMIADDAGGARVGPAVLGQPRTLELGVDVGVTGLDKYGVRGPRLGLLAGRRDLVDAIRARAIELGLEARPMLLPAAVRSLEEYRPERVRALVAATQELGDALERRLGAAVARTPFAIKVRGEGVLAAADGEAGIVPVEATAALAMQLLLDHGLLTVHFAAVPPGTSDLLLKFVPPETLASLGGADALAAAATASFERVLDVLRSSATLRELLYGASAAMAAPSRASSGTRSG
jgi:L-seryl-tRNA(Ser) seleniumtransferase